MMIQSFFTSIGQAVGNFFSGLTQLSPAGISVLFSSLGGFLLHFLTAVLAVAIIVRCTHSLLGGKTEEENWGFFSLPNGAKLPLNHWENIIGRARNCDIVLNFPTVSRQHAAVQRDEDGLWTVYPLSVKSGVAINGKRVKYQRALAVGDKVTIGGVDLFFFPAGAEELREQTKTRTRPGVLVGPTRTLVYLSALQAVLTLQLVWRMDISAMPVLLGCFGALCASMWVLYAVYRAFRRTGFDLESLAFFLTTLCLSITASSSLSTMPKQTLCVILGLFCFLMLSLCLRDLYIAKKLRWPVAFAACALLAFNVLFGQQLFGARNWVSIGPLSFQPSEFVKIAFLLAGAETMDRLFSRRNLIFTIFFSLFCVGCLAMMSDFGTALIFFIAFLTIAFLRSGDLPSVAMISAAACAGAGIILKFKPYIANRFEAWRHVWEYAGTTGYQQTRTMSAAASGGLFGNGAGNGWLKAVGAANTDLVFGMVAEELGMIVAVGAVVCILVFVLFAVKSAATSRSTFYVIASCSTATMLVFQTVLNVLGSVDLLPLTGVTFPFVSCGGSSMIACWTLLALIKAGDNRQNAGLSIPLPGRKDPPMRPAPKENAPMMEFDPSVFDAPPERNGETWDSRRDGIDIPLPQRQSQTRRQSIDIPLPGEERPPRRSAIDIPLDGEGKGAHRR